MLAVDTEGHHLRAHEPGVSFMVQWAGEDYEAQATGASAGNAFMAAAKTEKALLFANASYDVHCIRSTWGIDLDAGPWKIWDVQTLARIVMPERAFRGYKLEHLGDDLLGGDSTEQQRKLKELAKSIGIGSLKQEGAHRAVWDAYPRQLEAYGMEDVRLTYDLFVLLRKRASPSDWRVFEFECEVQRVLRGAERKGIYIDKAALAELRERMETALVEARTLLLEHLTPEALGDGDTPANQKALRAGLLGCGVPLYRTTDKSGELATNKDALMEFKDTHPVVGCLFEWRRLGKVLSTYVSALEKANPRVHASFMSCEARTSRMSARSPNVQNLPRGSGARTCIVPEAGNALVVCDYDSIEVWVLAHYLYRALGDRRLLDKMEGGMDQHRDSAAYLHSRGFLKAISPPDAPPINAPMSELQAYYSKDGPGGKIRTLAKNKATFPAIYGAGNVSIARGMGLPEETTGIKDAVLGAIPGYFDLYDDVRKRAQRAGFLRTITKRRLDTPRGKNHILVNSIVQGTAAEVMKLGMLAAEKPLAELGYQIILVVHDELVSEGPVELAPQALAAQKKAMESVSQAVDKDGDPLLLCQVMATGSYTTTSYEEAK